MDETLDEISGQGDFTKRNPPFSSEEAHTLVDLIDQHKSVIFDKSTSSATNCAKDTAWTNITKAFNMKGFPHTRDVDCMKLKWDNIKKKARRRTKNFTEIHYDEYDNRTARLVALIAEFETPTENEDGNNDAPNRNNNENPLPKLSRDVNRILNFAPEECLRLLQCVKAEKKSIFDNGTSVQATRLKNNAWTRVSLAFNRGNVHKRSTKVLKTKFENMKRLARGRVDNEAEASEVITRTNSATEPNNVKIEPNVEDDYRLLDSEPENILIDVPLQMDADNSHSDSPVTAVDPLAGVASGYSDVGARRVNAIVLRPVTDSDIVRLKAEILQCELETAQLKQCHEKEASARLLALRLREARLNVWIAEQKATQAGATRDVLQYRQDERAAEELGDGFGS